MKTRFERTGVLGICLVGLLCAGILLLPSGVWAKTKLVPIEGMSYKVGASLEDNLKALVGKKVSVTLDSGNTLTGLVKEVGDHLVHLEKLDGKEYYDALIRIERIDALEGRFRELQR